MIVFAPQLVAARAEALAGARTVAVPASEAAHARTAMPRPGLILFLTFPLLSSLVWALRYPCLGKRPVRARWLPSPASRVAPADAFRPRPPRTAAAGAPRPAGGRRLPRAPAGDRVRGH